MAEDEKEAGVEIRPMNKHQMAVPEGGWGWMTVLGTAISFIVFGVIVRAFGVTYLALLQKFGSSETVTSWVGAINMTASSFFGPLASALCTYYSCRTVTIAGSIISAAGVMATAFVPNILWCYLTFGLIAGFGISLTQSTGFIIVNSYFDKRKALAMSLATFGSGLGAIAFPPLMLFCFNEYGYTGSFWIISAICLQMCISGALYRPLQMHTQDKEKAQPTDLKKDSIKIELTESTYTHGNDIEKSDEITKGYNNKIGCIKCRPRFDKKWFDVTLLKEGKFTGLCILIFSTAFTLALMSGFIPVLAIQAGVDTTDAVWLLSVSGISSTVGTLALGFVLDLPVMRTRRLNFCNLCNLIIGITTILNPLVRQYWMFLVLTIVRGAVAGLIMSQRMTMTADTIGPKRVINALGVLLFFFSLGCLFGRAIGGSFKDMFGGYEAAFYLSGSINILASLVFVIMMAFCHKTSIPDLPTA